MIDIKQQTVLCLGTRIVNGKKSTAFQLLDESDALIGKVCTYTGIKASYVFPAAVCTLDATETLETIHPQSIKFVRSLRSTAFGAKVRLEHEAAETILAAYNQGKKAKNNKQQILEALKPLREVYNTTNAVGKLALEVRVLNYLRNGTDL